jgi:hypothetical protein
MSLPAHHVKPADKTGSVLLPVSFLFQKFIYMRLELAFLYIEGSHGAWIL